VYYFTVRVDVPRGKESEFDAFLEKAKKFWLSQPGVREFHVYGDVLIDWPERKIIIAVESREDLQHILDSEERKQLRSEMLSFVKHPVWQLLELKEYGDIVENIQLGVTPAMA
jgi:hypothetical protein